MVIKTIFSHGGQWETGEVEVHALPGIPNLHVVGLPDTQIRESGIKLKTALKSCGFKWPRGQQFVVNLRPNHFRKTSAGVEFAVALGVLGVTGQLNPELRAASERAHVYGEVALDGRVLAPHDLALALRTVSGEILTGKVGPELREGEWSEICSLRDVEVKRRARFFDWSEFWQKPHLPDLQIHPAAAEALWLASHMGLHVLLAGPQGSGKTTWARIFYALTGEPEVDSLLEREEWVGPDDQLRWRPFEQPHHSITTLAMVGGSFPIQPGVITRSHGGILLMDEFLEFNPQVLESLREPMENGVIEIARKGARERLPARFQLVGTTNLCQCGKLYPGRREGCPHRINMCGSVVRRMSGPLLDRFDMLVFSHRWLDRGDRVSAQELENIIRGVRDFRRKRGEVPVRAPAWLDDLPLNHRRRRSLMRVARGLADRDRVIEVGSEHFSEAMRLVVDPISELNQIFA